MTHRCIILILLSILAIMVSSICLSKCKASQENYTVYPFGPIDNPNVNWTSTQSVYGMLPQNFDININDNGVNQSGTAWKTLEIANTQDSLRRNMNLDFITNNNYQNDIGAAYMLQYAEQGLWDQF